MNESIAAILSCVKHSAPIPERIVNYLARTMSLTSMDNGELNIMDPFALAASTNPNILSHRDAMKADDSDKFHGSMDTEMSQLWDQWITVNPIYWTHSP